jgi:hypothetical protein
VRACEIGTVMFALRPDGTEAPAAMDLVGLAVPAASTPKGHTGYVIEVVTRVASRAARLPGVRIVSQPRHPRHLTAGFAPEHLRPGWHGMLRVPKSCIPERFPGGPTLARVQPCGDAAAGGAAVIGSSASPRLVR